MLGVHDRRPVRRRVVIDRGPSILDAEPYRDVPLARGWLEATETAPTEAATRTAEPEGSDQASVGDSLTLTGNEDGLAVEVTVLKVDADAQPSTVSATVLIV
jgi:hypothetical protein